MKNNYNLDNIHLYIFNWNKVSKNTLELYSNIKTLINNITIINCDEFLQLDNSIKHIQLDDSHYYGSQYNHAINDVNMITNENFIFCVIVGDNISNNNFELIFNSAITIFNKYDVGVYSPNDKRSPHTGRNLEIENNLFDVANTDCGFWFINSKIAKKLNNIDYKNITKFGWGIDIITIKESRKQNLLVLRDYNIETDQLNRNTNYNLSQASKGMKELQKLYDSNNFV